MDFNAVIDVVIGLTLVFLATSMLVTVVNEYIAQLFTLRGRQLSDSLIALIDEPAIAQALKESAVFRSLMTRTDTLPSYIDPAVFATEVLGVLGTQFPPPLAHLQPGALQKALTGAVMTSGNQEALRTNVAIWIDKALTMLGEGYKRKVQWISLIVGLVIAMAGNIDTIHIISRLYADNTLRQELVSFAQNVSSTDAALIGKCTQASQPGTPSPTQAECKPISDTMALVAASNESLRLPIGWGGPVAEPVWQRLLGWLLTALAVSLGSKFWFDLLSRVVNIRYGMVKPRTTDK